ncbi:FYVE, RhoGEF and PH domain-containing protein 6-like isoform X3 [Apostichopus japonicus]|uniref:FYVE, RhoGEF and PH domain-containing protein 6-like isoform X3 n=1 Tax=Stichopus japonicus TaxID=307972 RepID=UPI003AB6559F
MVTMDTRSKIRKLRKIFEPGNTSSFDLNQAKKTSQSLPRNPERTVNVLEDRSPGSNVFSKKRLPSVTSVISSKLSKSTGQLYTDPSVEPENTVGRSLSQNPLCVGEETIYAVPCNIPVKKEDSTAKPAAEYENTRLFTRANRRVLSYVRLFEAVNSSEGSERPIRRAGVTTRYKRPVHEEQEALGRLSKSLPDLAYAEGGVQITNAKGLFQKLNLSTSTPRKPPVPSKTPASASEVEKKGSNPKFSFNVDVSPSSSSAAAKSLPTYDEVSLVDNLRTRFEDPQTLSQTSYQKPKPSPKPVSHRIFAQNEYQTPGIITPHSNPGANVYEIPDNSSSSSRLSPEVEDPLAGSNSEDKLKKIFGVLSLDRDILAEDNNVLNPRKVKLGKKKKSLSLKNDNCYAVTQLPTNNTNSHLKGRKMEEAADASSSKGRMKTPHESSSLSADSGNSHTFSEAPVSPRTSGRKLSTQDSSQRDSDFIDGPEELEEPTLRVSDSDFESEEEGSKVKAPKPPAFNNNSHKVAFELLTSERTYVERLHLLSAIFQTKITAENEKQKWFSAEIIKVIFSNITSIYNFHQIAFLPELELRLLEWDRKPCIGDILKKISPFLRMYAEYISNFDKAMSQLNNWKTKVPKFSTALSNIVQNEKRCNGLALEHHMLEPVQRIPRYELLLKEYLKKLPDDSQDKEDALKALEVISQAAEHSNNRMKVMEMIGNLFKLNARIDGMDIIDPSRKLLKEGKLEKLTTRNDLQDRYIFLFNDMLLCCGYKKPKLSSKTYKLKEKLDVDGMHVLDSVGQRFQIEAAGVTLEFQAASEEDKEEWLQALLGAVRELIRKKDTFKNNIADAFEISFEDQLGKQPPNYIKDEEVTMCMRCGTDFEVLLKRRHHCRACGYVICGSCSCNQVEIPYDNNRLNRVCNRCFQTLGKQPVIDDLARRSFVPNLDETRHHATSLHLLQKNSWNKYWVTATQQDLFALKAPRDVRAVLTLPVKLYEVKEISAEDGVPVGKDYVFKLEHGQTAYYFAAESFKIKSRWMKILSDGLDDDLENVESTTL